MAETLRLGDQCEKIGSGATPRGGKETYSDDGPISLIRSQNVYNHRFSHAGLAFISHEQAAANMPSLSRNSDRKLSHEQVRQIVEEPLQSLLFPQIRAMAPLLAKLDFYVIETDDEVGFITSDHPCVWYDPEGYKRPPMHRGPALMYPTIEITFPVSPRQIIMLNRAGVNGYGRAKNMQVLDLNRRTRFFSVEHFVVRKNHTESVWLDPGEVPEDSWENVHAKELQQREECEGED